MSRTDDEIAKGWINYSSVAAASSYKQLDENPHFWAFEELSRLCFLAPNRALDIVLIVLAHLVSARAQNSDDSWVSLADDDNLLASLAAGPLEDVLVHHGSKVIERVENLAQKDKQFAELLSGVWEREDMPADVRARVKAMVFSS